MDSTTNKLLMGIFIVLVFGAGFVVGTATSGDGTIAGALKSPGASNEVGGDISGEGTAVNTSSLTDGQKKMLSALGIDAETINVTPEMIACAESSLGGARVEEIKNGATPSFLEGAKLVACYR